MRIAFVSEGEGSLDDEVSPRFGRAPTFVIVELNGEIKEVKVVKNPGVGSSGGAGIKAVQKMVDEKVDVVVAGNFGPNSLAALDGLGIKHVQLPRISIREAIERLRGSLS